MNTADRFLRYVSIDTQSSPDSGSTPSSEGQSILANELALELDLLGLEDIAVSHGCVYGVLPASEGCEDRDSVGLIAHMDTSPDCSGRGVKPRIVEYRGGDIILDEQSGTAIKACDDPALESYLGQHIIVTDGHTLLGADDKAGIAEIISALARLKEDPSLRHCRIPVCFTPDEEIGEGADHFDIDRFGAAYAYTVDGGPLGELEYENFNAATAKIVINGVNIHPGAAKGRMKNAALIATELAGMLPAEETPAHTDGYEGFYHLCRISGDEEKAELKYIIRDHSRELFERRKQVMADTVGAINTRYGEGTAGLCMKDTYYNMRELFGSDKMFIIERAARAMRAEGVEPLIKPIRGGTDGSVLSYKGLLCPNLSTGGHNFHGRFEYIPVESMEKMTDILVRLLTEEK